MQRQAVPVVKTRAPLVGTGMERIVARDSGVTTSARVVVLLLMLTLSGLFFRQQRWMEKSVVISRSTTLLSSDVQINQPVLINSPLVKIGDQVEVGDIIADGPATQYGELALGQNPVVAFMPWQGYNFEDSILDF